MLFEDNSLLFSPVSLEEGGEMKKKVSTISVCLVMLFSTMVIAVPMSVGAACSCGGDNCDCGANALCGMNTYDCSEDLCGGQGCSCADSCAHAQADCGATPSDPDEVVTCNCGLQQCSNCGLYCDEYTGNPTCNNQVAPCCCGGQSCPCGNTNQCGTNPGAAGACGSTVWVGCGFQRCGELGCSIQERCTGTNYCGNYDCSCGSGFVVTPGGMAGIGDINPHTLNLKSRGRYITAYIELPGSEAAVIDVVSIRISGIITEVNEEPVSIPAQPKPVEIGDHDGNGEIDLMVKFDRATLEDAVGLSGEGFMRAGFLIQGELQYGAPWWCFSELKLKLG